MKIKEFTPLQYSELKFCWEKLEGGPDMTSFQSYRWYQGINNAFIKEKCKNYFRKGIYVLLLSDNDEPKMIAPIQIVHTSLNYKAIGLKRGFYFIGRQSYSDYLNFIYNDFDSEYIQEIIKYIRNKYRLFYFCFENMIGSTKSFQYLDSTRTSISSSKFICTCVSLLLPNSFDVYNCRLSKSVRQNIRTAINRSNKDSKVFNYEIIENLDKDTIELLKDIRNQRLGIKKKKAYENASIKGKLYNIIRDNLKKYTTIENDILSNDNCSLTILVKEQNNIAAYFYGLYMAENKTFYLILAGVNEKYEWYSPGIQGLYIYIKDQYKKSEMLISNFDFTRGAEQYKYNMGGVNKPVYMINFHEN